MRKITIIGMIYKSSIYLDFMIDQIKRNCLTEEIPDHIIDFCVIANDATQEILNKLKDDDINHLVYNDPKPNDYYLNRVYRAWNFGGFNADGDIIVFVNSDMCFSKDWLVNLVKWLTPETIPTSLLIESGRMASKPPAISINEFGQSLSSFRESEFLIMAERIKNNNIDRFCYGGLYMPVAFYKDDFIKSGGMPEGNICVNGIGAYPSQVIQSGDDYFFTQNPIMKNKQHITIFSSVVFHFQQGEMEDRE